MLGADFVAADARSMWDGQTRDFKGFMGVDRIFLEDFLSCHDWFDWDTVVVEVGDAALARVRCMCD